MSRIVRALPHRAAHLRVAPRAPASWIATSTTSSPVMSSSSSFSSSSRVRLPRATPLHARAQIRAFHASNPSLGLFPFKLHDIGEGITEVEMIKWHVKVGDVIEEFDSLCEVQSDKSVVEITSPHAGKILKLNAETGKVVKVGNTLCEIETDAVDGAEEEASEPEPAAPTPPPPPAREAAPASAAAAAPPPPPPAAAPGKPAPRAPKPHPLSDTAVRFEGEASVLPQAPPRSTGDIPDSVEARRPGGGTSKRIVKASPATRALASRLGIELEDVSPTGDGGRVTKEDVERAAAGPSSSSAPSPQASAPSRAAASAPAAAAPRASAAPVDRGDASERMEMGRTRKVMYKAMGSMGSVPHFGYSHTLDLTNLLPLMRAANSPATGPSGYIASDVPPSMVHPAPVPPREKTSLLAFLVKALALALEEHPIMRARVKEANDERERYLEVSRDANIGIAVSDPQLGLLTPSLPPLDPSASVATVASELAALRKRAARPGPAPHMTISSVGGLGEARGAMPVLPPGGGLAIAAVGRAAWEVEWALREGDKGKPKDAFGLSGVWGLDAGQVEKAGTRAVLRCPVGWSGDHRVLEGAELIAFTETWKRFVEEPWRWVSV